jgi:4,5-dihydroxyphthalate decarboxylase
MTRNELELSIALTENDLSRPLVDGLTMPQGIRLVPTVIHPSEMYWRQLRFADFDVSEMSLSSLFIAASRGDRRWTALPVFTMRRFFHTGILVRTNAAIVEPGDLKGKRVGVPEYQQTAAIWSRGVLQHEFGVAPRDIDWFMERGADKSHGGATGFVPPAGVRVTQIAPGSSIGEMLLGGELDATLLYLNTANLVDRSRSDISGNPHIRRLFRDPEAEGRRYHAKTGLFPINHVVVVRSSLLERYPWIALNLYSAFLAARAEAERQARAVLRPFFETGRLGAEAKETLATDPMPYGVTAARRELETIANYVHEQSLADRVVRLDEVFAAPALDV